MIIVPNRNGCALTFQLQFRNWRALEKYLNIAINVCECVQCLYTCCINSNPTIQFKLESLSTVIIIQMITNRFYDSDLDLVLLGGSMWE